MNDRSQFDWRGCDAYLFDIDGTLLNSRDAVHYQAYLHAMNDVFGIACSISGVQVQGSTDPRIMRDALRLAGVSDERISACLPDATAQMCVEVSEKESLLRPELCPSVHELLRALHAEGRLLGVTSGNLEAIGWAKLRAAHLREYFAFGSFSDLRETRCEIFQHGAAHVRETLSPQARLCFVGDTPSDVEAAHAVGAPVIAVATGIFTVEELAEHGPELCLPSLDALTETLL